MSTKYPKKKFITAFILLTLCTIPEAFAGPEELHALIARRPRPTLQEVQDFVDQEGIDVVNMRNNRFYGRTSVHLAAQISTPDILEYLIQTSLRAKSDSLWEFKDDTNVPRRYQAIALQDKKGVDTVDIDLNTPLHFTSKNPEAARFLVANGANIEAKNNRDYTPLDVVSLHVLHTEQMDETATFLIREGAVVRPHTANYLLAGYPNTRRTSEELISRGLLYGKDIWGRNAMFFAITTSPEAVDFLLGKGVPWNEVNKDGKTPLEIPYANPSAKRFLQEYSVRHFAIILGNRDLDRAGSITQIPNELWRMIGNVFYH